MKFHSILSFFGLCLCGALLCVGTSSCKNGSDKANADSIVVPDISPEAWLEKAYQADMADNDVSDCFTPQCLRRLKQALGIYGEDNSRFMDTNYLLLDGPDVPDPPAKMEIVRTDSVRMIYKVTYYLDATDEEGITVYSRLIIDPQKGYLIDDISTLNANLGE